jgi:fucose 4-O-acetylase-like acetyltransferase
MGIFLVVVGHVLRGRVAASIIPKSNPVRFLDAWIYSFHMPLFFFLSGVFAVRSARKPSGTYVLDKFKAIVYPYLLWSLMQGLLQIALSSYTNAKLTFHDLLALTYRPPAQFWFLYVLFLIMMVYVLMKKAGAGDMLFFLLSVVLFFSIQFIGLGPWGVVYLVRANMIYFAAGALLSAQVQTVSQGINLRRALIGAGVALLGLTTGVYLGFEQVLFLRPVMAGLGILALSALAISLSRHKIFLTIKKWGILSLQIYVTHTIASAGFRIVVQKVFGYEAVWLHLVGGICLGIYFPILLDLLCRRLGFRVLFTLP